ncbi:hypothetical protein [Bosea psychrotolerans]|uniref:Uncharacterized protein n=1 Tax=Bosea psychrotolerans TaxID=1871628 RepID=A0A2S4MCL0_9HYPH|nr:hypothetical protein [Bosea psychrotolerans]POR52391.1 hypothetical protein CYD53_10556 [Bosea psychrotolerans]
MKITEPGTIIDDDPNAKLRPKPMSRTRRVVCFVVGLVFLAFVPVGLEIFAAGMRPGGVFFMAALGFGFAGLVLIGSALFPNATLARDSVDRPRNH